MVTEKANWLSVAATGTEAAYPERVKLKGKPSTVRL
jgi:hypothetical protein